MEPRPESEFGASGRVYYHVDIEGKRSKMESLRKLFRRLFGKPAPEPTPKP